MKRRQLFEFCDQSWLPDFIREAFFDIFALVHKYTFRPYHRMPTLLSPIYQRIGAEAVLDIGSGSGEQLNVFFKTRKKDNKKFPRYVLSDLFPFLSEWERLEDMYGKDVVTHYSRPLDFNHVPDDVPRHWSIYTAFHHLSPDMAKTLLSKAVEKCDSFVIAEYTPRSLFNLLSVIFYTPLNMLAPLVAKKFGFRKFLFTTIIPVLPLIAIFDGIVSVLRTYKKSEIIAMLPEGWQEHFTVEYYDLPTQYPCLKIPVFILIRKQK